jgi:dTDP-4-dehydrorhamnose 3,5-epimerase
VIEGVRVTQLAQFHDERGKVMQMVRADSEFFEGFGEIYFSTIYPGAVKAWHRHRAMTLNYAVVLGQIKFVLFDDRPDSRTKGELQELYISPENYYLVTVPPMIWNGFKAVGNKEAMVANCASIPHQTEEIERLPVDAVEIPYAWNLRHG